MGKRKNSNPGQSFLVMMALWEMIRDRRVGNRWPFTQTDLDKAAAWVAAHLGHPIGNKADVKGQFDSRTPFPKEIDPEGRMAWIKCGRGRYAWVLLPQANLIVPEHPDAIVLTDHTLRRTRKYFANFRIKHEQSTIEVIDHNDLISRAVGIPMVRYLSHDKTGVRSYGQFEVDTVFGGVDGDDEVVSPISVKGSGDQLSYSQAFSLSIYGAQRGQPRRDTFKIRPLGVVKNSVASDDFTIIEFSDHTEIEKIRILKTTRFRIQSAEESMCHEMLEETPACMVCGLTGHMDTRPTPAVIAQMRQVAWLKGYQAGSSQKDVLLCTRHRGGVDGRDV